MGLAPLGDSDLGLATLVALRRRRAGAGSGSLLPGRATAPLWQSIRRGLNDHAEYR
jgi:hypothetical protein